MALIGSGLKESPWSLDGSKYILVLQYISLCRRCRLHCEEWVGVYTCVCLCVYVWWEWEDSDQKHQILESSEFSKCSHFRMVHKRSVKGAGVPQVQTLLSNLTSDLLACVINLSLGYWQCAIHLNLHPLTIVYSKFLTLKAFPLE